MTDQLTLAVVLTAGGAVAAAGLITGLIAMAKNLPRVGAIIDAGNEPFVAYILSAVLVIAAYLAQGPGSKSVEVAFGAFLAWYGIANVSGAIHDDVAGLRGNTSP